MADKTTMDSVKEYGNAMLGGCVGGATTAAAYGGLKAAVFGPEAVGLVIGVGCAAGAVGAAIGQHSVNTNNMQAAAQANESKKSMAMN